MFLTTVKSLKSNKSCVVTFALSLPLLEKKFTRAEIPLLSGHQIAEIFQFVVSIYGDTFSPEMDSDFVVFVLFCFFFTRAKENIA